MPKGPRGEKRPADVVGAAVKTMKVLTGEVEEDVGAAPKRAKGGRKGGKARAKVLTAEERAKIAHLGAAARWKKGD